MEQSIPHLRREYSREALDTASILPDPFKQFEKWFNEAIQSQIEDANAMHLATVDEAGHPSIRVVLLKGLENNRFVFYTNYQSAKGRDLLQNPACALCFYWSGLERQVRINGRAERVEDRVSDEYFDIRPRGSQIGAWASPQSQIIANREALESKVSLLETQYGNDKEIPRPQHWGGYAITPHLIEFWQGRPNRLHDRIQYTWVENQWKINRLAP